MRRLCFAPPRPCPGADRKLDFPGLGPGGVYQGTEEGFDLALDRRGAFLAGAALVGGERQGRVVEQIFQQTPAIVQQGGAQTGFHPVARAPAFARQTRPREGQERFDFRNDGRRHDRAFFFAPGSASARPRVSCTVSAM